MAVVLTAAAVLVATVAGAGVFASSALASDAAPEDGDGANDTRENATSIEMNSTLDDAIDSEHDTDWFVVEVDDSSHLLADIVAHNFTDWDPEPPREKKDVAISIYGPDGEELYNSTTYGFQENAGANARVESGGTYYIKVEALYDANADEPVVDSHGDQPYTLAVESIALDTNEPNDKPRKGAGNATAFTLGDTVSTNIVGIDGDKYAVDLDAGDTIAVDYDVLARLNHEGASMPTRVFVHDAGGDRLYMTGRNGNASFTFNADSDGTYLITPTSHNDNMAVKGVRGNDATVYDLSITMVGDGDDSDGDGSDGDGSDGDDSDGDGSDGDDSDGDGSDGDDSDGDDSDGDDSNGDDSDGDDSDGDDSDGDDSDDEVTVPGEC